MHVPRVETIAPKVAVPRNIEDGGKEKEREDDLSFSQINLGDSSLRRHFQGCQRYSFENWYETNREIQRDDYMYNTIRIMGWSLNIRCVISTLAE